jgi:hypothetical protein
MQKVALGKIAVPTPGTRVALTADTTIYAAKIEFNADPAMAGTSVTVKDNGSGNAIASLLKPANGFTGNWETPTLAVGNSLRVSDYAVDAATANDGVFVTYWVN